MDIQPLFKAVGFLLLLIFGIPGNIFIIFRFTYSRLLEKKLLPTNIILMTLALANLLVLLSRIIPQFLNAIGIIDLLDDSECKLVIFTYRANRAMSICVTSLLSCYQCILITPNTKVWINLRKRVTQNILFIIIVLWIINISVYPYFVLNTLARRNLTTSPYTLHLVYCDADFLNYIAYIVNGFFYVLRDFVFVGLMILASSYIIYSLLQHEKCMKGIRSSDKYKRRTVEYKASRAVILLVILYVSLFGLDNSMWIYTLNLSNVSPDMNEIRIFLASSYSALSPVVIIITNPKLQQCFLLCNRKRPLSLPYEQCLDSNGQVYSISK
ncbi:olfactory receptor class A-like protein 1 [Spea bombifrons]|uniref:olfactory receptor class A-like protein 1 n=1 Tax=Spea bombifrons TaxID=233779 RepID=UPI0023499066|nr:olfactory receptor class A-like protein 1 [Spea bombifrons]